MGYLADRMSVNLELPTGESMQKLAPGKTHDCIFRPIRQIQSGIGEYRLSLEKIPAMERHQINGHLSGTIFANGGMKITGPQSFQNPQRKKKKKLCTSGTEYSDDYRGNSGERLPAACDYSGSVSEI